MTSLGTGRAAAAAELSSELPRGLALVAASRWLAAAGVPDAAVDARLLLCAAARIDRTVLLLAPDLPLGAEAARRLPDWLARRAAREPVSRILQRREFWGLDLRVTPAVLDPRPDTETLVEAALERLRVAADRGCGESARSRPWRILDLGTGSGAILCALLHGRPDALGWGIDRSAAACAVARDNLRFCGVAERALVVCGDWAAALGGGGFDLVVCNPPYIETATIATLEPDVREHDPLAALDGGADGLAAYRAIVTDLPRLLRPGGTALFEVGAGQAPAVAELCRAVGFAAIGTRRDLAGIERVVVAGEWSGATG